jgi:hypothetical protein
VNKGQTTLADLRSVVERLPLEDRKKAVSVLAEFPDCGLVFYDLKAELEAIEKVQGKGKHMENLDCQSTTPLFKIRVLKNLASIEIGHREVLRIVFLQDDFAKGYKSYLEKLDGDRLRNYWTDFINTRLEPDPSGTLQPRVAQEASEITNLLIDRKADAVAKSISAHLHRMTGDYFLPLLDIGIKAAVLEDHNVASTELEKPERKWKAKELKKMITEPSWRHAKPFLSIVDGRPPISNDKFMHDLRTAAGSQN